jgi:LemA protein
MLTSVWFWLGMAILVFWGLGAYNRLVRLRAHAVSSLQALARGWQQQAVMLRQEIGRLAQVQDAESQWATLGDDVARWRPLALAAKQLQATLERVLAQPHRLLPIDDVSALRAARDVLDVAWQRLQDSQDDLAGQAVPPSLQSLWLQHMQSTQRLLDDYNGAVKRYQEASGQFPALLIAWLFGFTPSANL